MNTKLTEMTNLMTNQLRTVESKALNFSSKLILVQVQLELEKDKNRKLVKAVKELRGKKAQKVRKFDLSAAAMIVICNSSGFSC